MRNLLILAAAVVATSGCTVVNRVTLNATPGTSEIFVTAGDIKEDHDVLGVVQAYKSGVLLFGNIDILGTDLEAGFKDLLIPYVKEMGGDGVTRVRFHMTQYTPWSRVLGAIFFIAPLPSSVTITGQVVKLKNRPAAAAAPVMAPVAAAAAAK